MGEKECAERMEKKKGGGRVKIGVGPSNVVSLLSPLDASLDKDYNFKITNFRAR
jgi:hypothetical protein